MVDKFKREIEKGLRENEFCIYLQPKFNLIEKKIIGAEALIRWEKGNKIIKPGEFIFFCERNNLIKRVDLFVFEEVCKKIRDWLDKKKRVIRLSFNVSRLDLIDNEFINDLFEIKERYDVPVKYLELEITETAMINYGDEEIFLESARKIKDYGFSLSIDDFGNGYSSLYLLCNLDLDSVKLDKVFFSERNDLDKTKIVIKNIILMAKELNIKVIAEGIENKKQIDFIKELGVEIIQGFYFCEAIDIKRFDKLFIDKKAGGEKNC